MARMKVVDQLHISSVGPGVMGKGTEFEVSDPIAADLQRRGLAVTVDEEKARPAPDNKMQPAPANKSAKPPRPKRGSQASDEADQGAE